MLVQKVKPSKSKAAVVVMKLDTMSGTIRHCGRTGVYKWQDDETVSVCGGIMFVQKAKASESKAAVAMTI